MSTVGNSASLFWGGVLWFGLGGFVVGFVVFVFGLGFWFFPHKHAESPSFF